MPASPLTPPPRESGTPPAPTASLAPSAAAGGQRHRRGRGGGGGPARLPGSWLGTLGLGLGLVAVAFTGGAISGKLEHRRGGVALRTGPTTSTNSTSTTSTTSTTSSTTPAQAQQIAQVKVNLVVAMTQDILAKRMIADGRTRAGAASSPAAVAQRHAAVARAWVPEKVPATQAAYDAIVRANALNPRYPSITDGQFVVTGWTDVAVTGTTAQATLVGHWRLTEPTNPLAVAGIVTHADQTWQVTMRKVGLIWLLQDRIPTVTF